MLRPKSYIEKLAPACHGGLNYQELQKLHINPEDVLDFSVCTNPFGPPAGISELLSRVSIDRYPDSEATGLINLLAETLNVKSDNVIAGNGSTEIIRLITQAYLGPEDCVLIPQPTYSEYSIASQMAGARIVNQNLPEENNFHLNVEEMLSLIERYRPRLIFICNPNNPTGQYLDEKEIVKVLAAMTDSLVVLDEAYIGFTDKVQNTIRLINRNNLIILRSMTKDYALAGLRLGYAVAGEPVISVLKKIKPPWNVNAAAQLAGSHALQSQDYIETCSVKMKESKTFLTEALKTLRLTPLPTQANLFLVKVGNAKILRESLIRRGILVRDCSSFGLPEYIRLSPRTLPECQKLISALKEIGESPSSSSILN